MTDSLSDVGRNTDIECGFVGRTRELHALQTTLSSSQRVAIIQGARGSGKTALLRMFERQARHLFPGGYEYTYGYGPHPPAEFARQRLRLPLANRALLVVDEADAMTSKSRSELADLLSTNPKLCLLLATSEPISFAIGTPTVVELSGLSLAEYRVLLSRHVSRLDLEPQLVDRLWASTAGHAMVGCLAARTIRDNILTWNQLLQAVEGTDRSPVFGPNGQRISSLVPMPRPIVIAVSDTNAELVEMLRKDPTELYSLSPRRFEEIVAELLSRLGYTITLTPASADGGFDMYAARSDELGRFLYLVECKRYTPPEKVGVQIVRSLYGVVQQRRANAGIIATTSFFTKGAKEMQQQLAYQMHLRDYLDLQKWLV